jgi:hypothetical protein
MKKLAALFLALGMLFVAVAPAQAAYHSTRHHHQRQAHLTHVKKAPTAYAAVDSGPAQPAQLCTYMGGPKSTLWGCH